MRFFEGDQAAGKLEEGERWFSSFFDQRISSARLRTVQPGVAGLDDPAAGAPAGRVELEFDLFAAGADVRREAAFNDSLAHRLVVVAAIEAQPLRAPLAGLGPADRDRVERRVGTTV